MPKKHQFNYLANTHGPSGIPTSSTSNVAKSPSTRGVNERLEQLRREQAPRPTKENWNDVSTIATQKTIPPHLRHILALPETAPPRNRRGVHQHNRRPRGDPFTAGPPAPTSWVDMSMHAPAGARARARREIRQRTRAKALTKTQAEKLRQRPERFSLLSRLPDAQHALPSQSSLKHQALRTLAENWDWLAEYESNNLAALPAYLKSHLLTYLSLYGPEEDISLTSLKSLFFTEAEVPGGTGTLEVGQLDLTGLLSHEFTLSGLTRYMARKDDKSTLDVAMSQLDLGVVDTGALNGVDDTSSVTAAQNRISVSSAETLDSWEEAAESISPPIASSLSGPRFASLTRLSLAQAGIYASWSQLLTLAPHLHRLTHLSLAHWPIPSVTPNSRTTFVQSRHGEVNLGGTHLYSAMDDDWYEAANILRRLSKDTFSLQWLDLEGCVEWVPALTWEGGISSTPDRWVDRQFQRQRQRRGVPGTDSPVAEAAFDPAEEQATTRSAGPDWTSTWSQVTFVNVSQGSLPQNVTALRSLPAGRVCLDLLLYLRERDNKLASVSDEDAAEEPEVPAVPDYDLQRWVEGEKAARKVAAQVHLKRSAAKGRFCVFDHGWKMPAPVKREALSFDTL